MEKIFLIGSSGHGKVVCDIVEKEQKFEVAGFLDDDKSKIGFQFYGYQTLGSVDDISALAEEHGAGHSIICIGDNFTRKKTAEKIEYLTDGKMKFASAVHPSASVAKGVEIGEGSVIMAGVTLNSDTDIRKHCIINTRASIDHDCVIEDYASIAPGAVLGGSVRAGRLSAVGIGAVVSHGVKIGADTVIGGASYANKDIGELSVAYGVPCKLVRGRKPDDKYL